MTPLGGILPRSPRLSAELPLFTTVVIRTAEPIHRWATAPGAGAHEAARQHPLGILRGAMLSAIDHVGVAVESIDAALELYRDRLGMPLVHRETVAEQGVDAALLDVGDGHIELLQPLGPDTAVGKFLSRRGPGLHHVAYRVASVQETLDACAAAGMRLIDEQPRTGIRNSRVAFVHPASTGGVLTEIVQPAGDH
ncbi:MAG TPA: methylmalonyl-CoA epimerase [Solirubrobacteraceae bacterium]|nr:methylmalonyl-CoA epimerase [Solirubrobacteraceae bacterium]